MPKRLTAENYHALAAKRGMKWRGTGVPLAKEKSLWICPVGHKWLVNYDNVRSGKSCPTCWHERHAKERRLKPNDYRLLAKRKRLRWLGPVVSNARAKSNWRCQAKGHTFEVTFDNLSKPKSGCPYCSGRRTGQGNSLADRFPDLAKEWHPTLNGDLKPADVTPASNRRVWWVCKRGHTPWRTAVTHRTTQRTGCPACAPYKTSRLELRVYSELLAVFGDVRWRHRIDGRECDVYLPDLNIGIEIDGRAWHGTADKQEKDRRKTALLKKHGVELYRIRESPLRRISARDIVHAGNTAPLAVVKAVLRSILKHGLSNSRHRAGIRKYLSSSRYANSKEFERLVALLPGPPPERSLAAKYPQLAKEWLGERNGPITPNMVWPVTHEEYWWQCPKVSYHQYKRAVYVRTTQGQGCPLCNSRKEVHPRDSLAARFPRIAREWDRELNDGLTPDRVTPNSGRHVWWRCPAGHAWQGTPDARVGPGRTCPVCKSLAVRFPVVASQWHPTKNGRLRPEDVAPMSGRKIWWQCSKGHAWNAVVARRTALGTGCPYCAREKRPKRA